VKGEGAQIVMKFISLLSQQNAVQGYDKITTLIQLLSTTKNANLILRL
jgi:hypothetical protein